MGRGESERATGIGASDDESVRALNKAFDLGLNFIDTALGYGEGHSERLIGQAGAYNPNVSRSTHEVSRPLLTPDEAMRMKGARKNAQGMITEAGNMVVYVAGYPAIMGLQPLYFRDPELARRARLAAESAQAKKSPTLANASV
jgi:Type IV secretory system Conjugative DNA transfer/Aldo/keto reductase family